MKESFQVKEYLDLDKILKKKQEKILPNIFKLHKSNDFIESRINHTNLNGIIKKSSFNNGNGNDHFNSASNPHNLPFVKTYQNQSLSNDNQFDSSDNSSLISENISIVSGMEFLMNDQGDFIHANFNK